MFYMIATCIFMYSRYMIISRYWYWYFLYWTCELLICDMWNPTSIIFCFPLSCFMLSTELMSCYHVTCTMYWSCSWYSVYIKCVTYIMGLGRLDGWLDLIGLMFGSIICPTLGDMVVLANFPFPIFRYLFHPSGLALVSAARESW